MQNDTLHQGDSTVFEPNKGFPVKPMVTRHFKRTSGPVCQMPQRGQQKWQYRPVYYLKHGQYRWQL